MLLDKFDEFPIKNEVRPSIFFFEVEAGIIDSFLDIKEWEFKFILFLNQRKTFKTHIINKEKKRSILIKQNDLILISQLSQ
ncbi:unnamed protein product [Rhizophagus irregularis]|uniref:Uncharacterized protein n=1 Tax=Rhizophagus irregularis TaxID=588596 RepID=A0A916E7T8_9GLOM|nr:unnamed protein product [Rhizophagus irregularis]CAB5369222.1 unnamed protein product [Rhizophagus irregularis]